MTSREPGEEPVEGEPVGRPVRWYSSHRREHRYGKLGGPSVARPGWREVETSDGVAHVKWAELLED